MKRWSLVLIILGLLIIAYPTLSDTYRQWELQRLLLSQANLDFVAQEEFAALQNTLANAEGESEVAVSVADTPSSDDWPHPVLDASEVGESLGVLKIASINLTVPIYAGAEEAQLKEGVGQMVGTGRLCAIGNAALAGHRRTFFRNLDKLQPGDEIVVELGQQTLRYQVYKIHIVDPTDVSVLNRSRRHSLLTLVTCHPLYTSKQRLIVHAYLKSSK